MAQNETVKREEEILKFWQENKIFEKSLAKKSPKGNFVFYEGPPTANAAPGVHHVLARAFKDVIPRYKTMQGYKVKRKAGWDTHGLPVELQVEKKLGLKSKLDIESIIKGDPKASIQKFNEECKKIVWQFKEEWEKLTARIAYWVDMENSYITYKNDYIESVWQVIKKAETRKLLYQGNKVIPFCTRCGTALSSHEVAQGYENIEEDSIYIKCKVTQGNKFAQTNDYILTWTTTPWTLPGNVALAVGSDFIYARVKVGKEHFILQKDLIGKVITEKYIIEVEFKGNDLLGVFYEPLFSGAVEPGEEVPWRVVIGNFVNTSEGTGVVHTAVMYGEEDYQLGEIVGLPKQHTVGLDGKFLPQVKDLAGLYVKDEKTTQLIYEHLKKTGAFYKTAPYRHDYPFCWRCHTPLLYYAKDSWFIKMSALRDDLIKNAKDISWVPEHIKEGRFGEWLAGIKDWAISRERYWGTPLPIWKCQSCKQIKVVGSQAELEAKIDDLHRPFIDSITFKCQCGGEMWRVPEVLDVWFDSGSMPLAQYHYPFENKKLIDSGEQYPADYISEAIDQTRCWFYTLLAIATIMGKGASFKNVICLGHINDAKGQKMSKSKGNIINPWEVIEGFGADALRWYLYTINQPGETKNFDMTGVKESMQKVIMLLGNVISFYKLYGSGQKIEPAKPKHVLDKWIVAKLEELILFVTVQLDLYHITESARAILEFINELSTWYVRRSRERFKSGDEQGVVTLGYVLSELVKLMAPFTPFAAEYFYKELGGKLESVHLEDWPTSSSKGQVARDKLLKEMAQARKIVENGLAARAECGIKVRQALSSFCSLAAKDLNNELAAIVCDELNVKELKHGEEKLDTEITPELKLEGLARELTRQINNLRKEAGLTIKDKIEVYYDGDIAELLEKHENDIKKATLTKGFISGSIDKPKVVKIDDQEIKLEIRKI